MTSSVEMALIPLYCYNDSFNTYNALGNLCVQFYCHCLMSIHANADLKFLIFFRFSFLILISPLKHQKKKKLWVVTMISKQPFYMTGLEDEEQCKNSASGALALFIVTFIASITFVWYDSVNKVQYTEVSEHEELLPRGMSIYNVRTDSGLELPDVITSSQRSLDGQEEQQFGSEVFVPEEDLLGLPPIS